MCSIPTACSPKIPASLPRSCSKSSAQLGSWSTSSTNSELPLTVFLNDLAVALDAAAVAQVLDHVPVDGADVLAADGREAGTDGEVDRAVHLLVEERVLHVALDAGIAADPVLAEDPRALVTVELREERLLVARRRRLDDLAALVAHPDVLDQIRLLVRGVLDEADRALGRLLDRAVEDLAAGHVRVAVVDLALAPREAESEIGLGAHDPDVIGLVEAILDPFHLLALSVPVEEDGAVEEVLERLVRQAGLLGEGGAGEAAGHPRDLHPQPPLEELRVGLVERVALLRRDVGAGARVLRRAEQHPGVDVVPGVLVYGSDRLEQRPRRGLRDDHHLPAGLDVDRALDQQSGVFLDARVGHDLRHSSMKRPPPYLLRSRLDFLQGKHRDGGNAHM